MRLELVLLSLLAAAPAAAGALRLPQLPPSLLWDGAGVPPAAQPKPVCEQKPLVAQAPLPDARAYFHSYEAFQTDGMVVRVAGSKDRRQKYGYFLAFLPDGDGQPVWVKMGLGKKSFSLRGKPFTVETHLCLLHHERIRLTVRRGDGAVVADFTVGELAARVQDTGAKLTLLGREFRATYVEDISESDGGARILSNQHTVLLTTYDTYQYDGGRTGYKFTQIPLQAEPPARRLPGPRHGRPGARPSRRGARRLRLSRDQRQPAAGLRPHRLRQRRPSGLPT